jgi:hypothetical protein
MISKCSAVKIGVTFATAFGYQAAARAADTGAALSAIADTADRICGIVATQGDTSASKVSGDVHAELSGLAKRLASLGVSGTGDITSLKYEGLLQQDLPATLKDIRECKLKVLEKLQSAVLPAGSTAPSEARAPTPDLLQSPSSASIVDTAKSPNQQDDYGLYGCAGSGKEVTCYVVVTRSSPGQGEYTLQQQSTENIKLIDNFHVEHRLRRAYFVDGLGGHQQAINLSTGESIWLFLEFDPGPRVPSSARIVFSPYSMSQLRGPVSQTVTAGK